MRCHLAVAFLLISAARVVPAQPLRTMPAEDSSLAGIKTVGLIVLENP